MFILLAVLRYLYNNYEQIIIYWQKVDGFWAKCNEQKSDICSTCNLSLI